jgi:hypothetical protein
LQEAYELLLVLVHQLELISHGHLRRHY